jgi:hypothetical protein
MTNKYLAAGNDPDQFNTVAFGQESPGPFMPMDGEAVVLDQN